MSDLFHAEVPLEYIQRVFDVMARTDTASRCSRSARSAWPSSPRTSNGPLTSGLRGIHWVIVGGESGPRARPMDPAWAIDLREQCRRARVPFFFKQWGGTNKKLAGRELEGRTWDQMPAAIGGDGGPRLRRLSLAVVS